MEKNQQSFIFEKDKQEQITRNRVFKLPSLDLLEKSKIQINNSEINKSRPDPKFIEKVLLDFGIEGKIKKINNGPVVSLYEFEPAAGIKVSKIINLSDDLARNTSSTSARVSVIPGKNTEAQDGEKGILAIYDLANLGSSVAIMTGDIAIKKGNEFELVGRDETLTPRGCSLAAEELISRHI